MAFMNWSNDYSVNVDQIDTQHKKLFDMVNGYSDALQQKKSAEAVAQLVNGLALYTISHFRNEEKLFDKYGYSEAENHKKKHAELLTKVGEINNKVKEGTMVLSTEVGDFLKEWLNNHIKIVDKQYSKCFNENGLS